MIGEVSGRLSRDEFRHVIGHFTSGVTVITTVHDDTTYATTASAVSSLSDTPPMLLVCMNRTSDTGQALAASRRFAVNVLAVGQHELAVRCARKGADKLQGVALAPGATTLPIVEDALATLECTVVEEARAATHVVYLAEVDALRARSGEPLVYYRGAFAQLGASLA